MKKRRKSDVKKAKIAKTDTVRVEHLNYKVCFDPLKRNSAHNPRHLASVSCRA